MQPVSGFIFPGIKRTWSADGVQNASDGVFCCRSLPSVIVLDSYALSAVQHAFSEASVSVDEVMAGMLGTIHHIVLYCNQTFRKWCKEKKIWSHIT